MIAKLSRIARNRKPTAIARGPTLLDGKAKDSYEDTVFEPSINIKQICVVLNKAARNNRSKKGVKPVFDQEFIIQALQMSIGLYRYEIQLRDSQPTDPELLEQANQLSAAANVLKLWLSTMHPRLRNNMRKLLNERQKDLTWDRFSAHLIPILDHLQESALAAGRMTVSKPRLYRKGPAPDQSRSKLFGAVHDVVRTAFTPRLKTVPARELAAELLTLFGIRLPQSDKHLRRLLAEKRDRVELEIGSFTS
ncbi:MAG: hypothetical protein EOP62_18480 [Sphingomonadales bacterium]|nr:MAG: hypothetical protein EOP62_18480 [Sphingomonadales bacterium]